MKLSASCVVPHLGMCKREPVTCRYLPSSLIIKQPLTGPSEVPTCDYRLAKFNCLIVFSLQFVVDRCDKFVSVSVLQLFVCALNN